MKQQMHWSGHQPSPQKAPHPYSWQILTFFIAAYLCSLLLMSIASSETGGSTIGNETAAYQMLVSLAAIALLGLHALIIFSDAQNFFTLHGKIHWRSIRGWLRMLLGILYLSFWIMPALYLFFALKYFLATKALAQAAQGAQASRQQTPARMQQVLLTHALPGSMNAQAVFGIALRVILYLLGVFVTEFGIFGIALYGFNDGTFIECSDVLLGMAAAVAGLIFFFRRGYHLYSLYWVQYIWWLLGLTASGIIALTLFIGFITPQALGYVLGSCVLALYGIGLVWLAWLQPSLGQAAALKVATILNALPGKQLSLPELIVLLQRDFHCSEKSARRYLGTLNYVEQVERPGLATPVCRLKQAAQALPLAQLPTARMPALPGQSPDAAPPPPPPPPPPSVQRAKPQAPGHTTPAAGEEKRASTTVKVFFCYARADKDLLDELEKHLSPLKRLGQMISWHDRELQAGTEWEKEIDRQLRSANLILLLISPDFFSSDYCYSVEMKKALAMQKEGRARVVPIILRPVDWKSTPLRNLQVLPTDGTPVTLWPNQDQVLATVAQSIRRIVEAFLAPSHPLRAQTPAVGSNQPHQKHPPVAGNNQNTVEVEQLRTSCRQGQLVLTDKRIIVEPPGMGPAAGPHMLLRSSLAGVESSLAAAPIFGMGGCVNLTFRGKSGEILVADIVAIHTANALLTLLKH
ncbi:MAG TPA: toll/interleukin-1 receptor domain-containing protein [Ktedonobacteraceae bacterium]|jgi:hypothetical protein